MNQFQIIVLATPVFFVLIGLEFAWGHWRERRGTGHNNYRLNDSVNSISLGVLSQLGGVFSKLVAVGIYGAVFSSVALFPDTTFWSTWYGVLLALVFYDFCYYWVHRAGHRSAVFWAAHVVHHQSQQYNLSTALRQTSSGMLLSWVFYLPMAVAGVPPMIFGIVALIDLLYQFWVHTEQIGKLGWFDRVFCSPSNHRVHHAVNDPYLDKNYGGILVLWDRLFGTFKDEQEPCVYGTRSPLNSWDPLWANAEVYAVLLHDSWHAKHWGDKLRVWVKPPGWRPADVALRFPKPDFDMAQVNLFNPSVSRTVQWFCGLQFVALLGAVSGILWFADSWPVHQTVVLSLAVISAYWALGAALQGRLGLLSVLMLESAALSTVGGTLGWESLYLLFKPLTMLLAIWMVARRAQPARKNSRFQALLAAALTASLVGDVFLMLPGNFFIPGLAAFLVAHLCYLSLLRQGVPFLPSRSALLGTLACGLAMLAVLWSSLGDPVLKGAVSAYVLVISLMAAQALGRAQVLSDRMGDRMGDRAAQLTALGACVFLLSDSLLAVNRFVQPLPLASFWVLGSYYVAQWLLVHHAQAAPAKVKHRDV